MNGIYFVQYSTEALNDLRKTYSYIAFDLLAPDALKLLERGAFLCIHQNLEILIC